MEYDEPDAKSCKALMNAILFQMVKDFIEPSDAQRKQERKVYVNKYGDTKSYILERYAAYQEARLWFGTTPRDDFSEVCELSGHEPEAIHERVMAIHDSGEDVRRAAVRLLSSNSEGQTRRLAA